MSKEAARRVLKRPNNLHPFDWDIDYREVDKDNFEIDIKSCGFIAYAKRFGGENMLHAICRIDYLISNLMGVGLLQTWMSIIIIILKMSVRREYMFCKKCGSAIQKNAKICNRCGAELQDYIISESKAGKKSRKSIIIITFAVVLIAIVAFSLIGMHLCKTSRIKSQLILGEHYISEMQYEEAIAVLEKVIQLDDKCVDAYLLEAEVYGYLEDYESAINILEQGFEKTDNQSLQDKIEENQEIIDSLNTKDDETIEEPKEDIIEEPKDGVDEGNPEDSSVSLEIDRLIEEIKAKGEIVNVYQDDFIPVDAGTLDLPYYKIVNTKQYLGSKSGEYKESCAVEIFMNELYEASDFKDIYYVLQEDINISVDEFVLAPWIMDESYSSNCSICIDLNGHSMTVTDQNPDLVEYMTSGSISATNNLIITDSIGGGELNFGSYNDTINPDRPRSLDLFGYNSLVLNNITLYAQTYSLSGGQLYIKNCHFFDSLKKIESGYVDELYKDTEIDYDDVVDYILSSKE